ncbi:NIPSNAP family protein [Candidatus Bipolaricaulota bacterium]
MIYECRVYTVVPGRMGALHALFRDHTCRIFERHGMKVVGFFTTEIGERNDQLTYLLGFDSLADRERAWSAFRSDPEWAKVKAASEKDGPIVLRLSSAILTPTDYSPLR